MLIMATITCKIMGVVFIAVAIWGFIAGHAVLIFHVNTAHNIVHLLSGLTALACGFAGEAASRSFSIVFGIVYGLVAILGFAGVQAVVDLLHLNMADNWLHAGISLVFLVAGLIPKPVRTPAAA
jgi:hypothetical protein